MDRRTISRAIVAALFVIALLTSAPGVAPAQDVQVTFTDVSSESDFPNGVTFHLGARSPEPIVEAVLLYAQAELETLHLEAADIEPSTDVDVEFDLDLYNNYLPPGVRLTYRWRLTTESGATFDSEPQIFEWTDTRFDWKQLATDQVSVWYYASDEAFAQSILDTAQQTIDRLRADYGLAQPSQIRLWVYESGGDFNGAQIPNSQEWIVGSAFPDLGLILAVLPDGSDGEVGRVVPHEITHQVLRQASENPFNVPPLWFDEGFAVFQQGTGNDHFPGLVMEAAAEDRLLPLRYLTAEYPFDPDDVTLSYAQGFSVVNFIVERWGAGSIGALVNEFTKGITHDQAFTAALGVTVDELERLWREHLASTGGQDFPVGSTDSNDSGTNDLFINGSAILLTGAAIASGVVAIRRYRKLASFEEEPEGDAMQSSSLAIPAGMNNVG